MNEAKVKKAYQVLLSEPRAGVACSLAENLLREAITEGARELFVDVIDNEVTKIAWRDAAMQDVEVVWQAPSKEPIGYIKTDELQFFMENQLLCDTAVYKKSGRSKSPIYLNPLRKGQVAAGYIRKSDISALESAKQQCLCLLHPTNHKNERIAFYAEEITQENLLQGPVADIVGVTEGGHTKWLVTNIQSALWSAPKENRHPWHRRLTVYAAPQTPTPWPHITRDEVQALERFKETSDDGEGYDVPKPMMRKLSEIGLVYHTSRGIYGLTDFGHTVLETLEKQNEV